MKVDFKILTLIVVVFLTFSCKNQSKKALSEIDTSKYAAFDWFNYKGEDAVFDAIEIADDEYLNPILAGFYPDPSICRVEDKFYLITSTFTYFPGIPVFESTDLINWKQIGHVIDRKEQADFSGMRVSRGMFAPTIRYNNGTFYVICTNVDAGGNFIVTSEKPEGPWSDPIWIKGVDGIDPDLFFDEDGKLYITHNGPPPNNISLYDGHRAIYMFEFDLEKEEIVGESKLLVNGGTDIEKNPVWIEAPHVFKKDEFYYLICAEGGTGFNHSEVVFRSKNVSGPYEVYENNPILTQRHLDPNRENQITTTGHADFVELPNGDWWAVFLACRPYGQDMYNTGRETFLMPVAWKNNWPEIVGGNDPIPFKNKKPNLPVSKEFSEPLTGNFEITDNFDKDTLDFKWNFVRTPLEKWHEIKNGYLLMKSRDESIHTLTNFSFIGRRQQHLKFEASTKLMFHLKDTAQAVGLVAFQNEKHYLFIGKRLNSKNETEVFLESVNSKVKNGTPKTVVYNTIDSVKDDLFLKIVGKEQFYDFYYKTSEEENWKLLKENVDAKLLSTKEAGGFVGTYIAMYVSNKHFE